MEKEEDVVEKLDMDDLLDLAAAEVQEDDAVAQGVARVDLAVSTALDVSRAIEDQDVSKTMGFLRHGSTYLHDLHDSKASESVSKILKVVSKTVADEQLLKKLSKLLRSVADILEHPTFLQTTAASAQLIADTFENQAVKGWVDDAYSFAENAMENQDLAAGVRMAQEFLNSDEVKEASLKTIILAQRVLESETMESSIKLATALAQDKRLERAGSKATAYAQTFLANPTVKSSLRVSGDLATSIATRLAASETLKGAAKVGLAVASHPLVSAAVRSSASTTLSVATSSPVKASMKLTGKAAIGLFSIASKVPKLVYGERTLEELQAEYVEMEKEAAAQVAQLDTRLSDLNVEADKLRFLLSPILEEINDKQARKNEIKKLLALKRAEIARKQIVEEEGKNEGKHV